MPNGRHGAVLIARDAIVQLFSSLDAGLVAGSIGGRNVLVSDVRELLGGGKTLEYFVEAQYERHLVIHLDPKHWLWVDKDGPVFPELLELWKEWLRRPAPESES